MSYKQNGLESSYAQYQASLFEESAAKSYENSHTNAFADLGITVTAASTMDSYVRNKIIAKGSAAVFNNAMSSGIYQNNPIAGSHMLTGQSMLNKLPGFKQLNQAIFKKTTTRAIPGTKGNYSFNYVHSEKYLKGKVNDGINKLVKAGANPEDYVSSGWGISKNYSGFFNELKKSGFRELTQEQMTKEGFGKALLDHMTDDSTVYKKILPKGVKRVKGVKISRVRGAATATKATLKEASKDVSKIKLEAAAKLVKTDSNKKILTGLQKVTKVFTKSEMAEIAEGKIKKEFLERGATAAAGKFAGGLAKGGVTQNFLKAVTGVGMGFSLPILAVSLAASHLANVARERQENSVNNYVNARRYKGDEVTNKVSDAAYTSINNHSSKSYNNDMDFNFVMSTANLSKRIVDSYDPVQGLDTSSHLGAFDTF
jgi:hypothetical protein